MHVMAALQDPTYVKLCAQLASRLSISLASARRRVDQAAAQKGGRDLEARRTQAREMLAALDQDQTDHGQQLDQLLQESEGNSYFQLED